MSRHEDDDERNVFDLLRGFYRKTNELTGGKEHGPAVTGFARLAVVVLVLACAGPILWQALLRMPTPLVVVIAAFIALRVAGWLWRRYH